jgi:hypothetical protein
VTVKAIFYLQTEITWTKEGAEVLVCMPCTHCVTAACARQAGSFQARHTPAYFVLWMANSIFCPLTSQAFDMPLVRDERVSHGPVLIALDVCATPFLFATVNPAGQNLR